MHSISPWTRLVSWRESRDKGPLFDQLNTYVLFVGHPRSGTSVTGSLLNAHRNALVCNELNVLRYIGHGYRSRTQLLWLHCMRDAYFERIGRRWTGYDYRVAGGHQGQLDQLQVVGDKKAARTADALRKSSKPLHLLQEIVQAPVRLVHVLRHPLDVIGRVCLRQNIPVRISAQQYFTRCATVQRVIEENEFPMHTMYLEELIWRPSEELAKLTAFCRLNADPAFIAECARTLIDQPRQCRDEVPWGKGDVASILRDAERFPCLQYYAADQEGSAHAA